MNDVMVLPPDCKPYECTTVLAKLSKEVGLSIKESKNEEGTRVNFTGVELDTQQDGHPTPNKKATESLRHHTQHYGEDLNIPPSASQDSGVSCLHFNCGPIRPYLPSTTLQYAAILSSG